MKQSIFARCLRRARRRRVHTPDPAARGGRRVARRGGRHARERRHARGQRGVRGAAARRPGRPRRRAARADRARGRLVIKSESGARIWDTTAYGFLAGDAPATVNPSLWRQAKLNDLHGLFEVTSGVYQVRGYDVSNMTIIEGKTGRIVVDPLTARETAAAAWRLVEKTLGAKPVTAVIFTHSHLDHFGGVEGVISADEIAKRKVRVVAPARFLEEASSENVLAGVPMLRRAQFMYGHAPAARSARPRRHRARQGARARIGRPRGPHRSRRQDADRARARRRALRVPVHARVRGARGDDLLPAGEEGVLQRRDRQSHDAQPVHAARREGARRAAAGAATSTRRSCASATPR